MIFCTNCGLSVEQGTKFCIRCGTKIVGETAPPPLSLTAQPLAPPPGAPQPAAYVMPAGMPTGRACTKCSEALESDTLFCPGCGTKNYVSQPNKLKSGDLLVTLRGCSLIKLQFLRTSGTLYIHDDRLFFQSDTPGGNIVLGYPELTGVSPHTAFGANLCLKLTAISGKAFVFSLSDSDADFYYYVINLIADYRY